jgi:hypothetical protein
MCIPAYLHSSQPLAVTLSDLGSESENREKTCQKMTDPITANENQINSFTLDFAEDATPESAIAVLKFLLSSGDKGYKGQISGFDPAPSADNDYLWDGEMFTGRFTDKSPSAESLFEFEVWKEGDGWQRVFGPVSDTADNAEDTPVEEVKASLRRALQEAKDGQRIPLSQMYEG